MIVLHVWHLFLIMIFTWILGGFLYHESRDNGFKGFLIVIGSFLFVPSLYITGLLAHEVIVWFSQHVELVI